MDSLQELRQLRQSIWLDYIRRDLITSGGLKRLIQEDGVSGITSNPTIFAKALSEDSDYDSVIAQILRESPELDSPALFEKIEIEDLRMAADALCSVYDQSNGDDGFVSIEVSPKIAYDPDQSVSEARRLWAEVARPNLMVKIPATHEGLPAIEQLISEGINVNVTLMFSVSQYAEVAEAYLRGIERAPDPKRVRSVASFFVSRVDTAVDKALEEGVHLQKPLWASTSTKNKAYSDVMYIEGLIGPDTINSMPPETLEAFRDHGRAKVTLGEGEDEAGEIVGKLVRMGIILKSIGQELTDEGVDKFAKSYDELIQALDKKRSVIFQTLAA